MINFRNTSCSLIFILLLFACQADKSVDNQNNSPGDQGTLFTELGSKDTGIKFINDIEETPSRNLNNFDYMYNGAGVAIGDINNDNLPDIFFTGNDSSNRLYLNKGNLQFEDITEKAKLLSKQWSSGVTMVDINEDGYLDIYVCNSGPTDIDDELRNKLYINNGDLTFTESAKKYGLDIPYRSVQASFFDYDKDGDLDMWLNNHGKRKIGKSPHDWYKVYMNELDDKEKSRIQNAFYRNDGNVFTEISSNNMAFSLGLSIADFNEDDWLDVYCANDYFVPDYFFQNNKAGGFTENAENFFNHASFYAMGADAADYNNDGILDLAVVDMTPEDHFRNKTLMESMDVNRFRVLRDSFGYNSQYMFNSFYQGAGYGYFLEIGNQLGVAKSDWSWSPLLADFDNDGYKDYFISNGFFRDTKNQDYRREVQRYADSVGQAKFTDEVYLGLLEQAESNPVLNVFFLNEKGEKFKKTKAGIKTPNFSNGAAYGDLDNDGDLEIVINNLRSEATILKNNTNNKNYLKVKLHDNNKQSTVKHAEVYLYQQDKMQRIDYSFTRGYQSFMEPILHFGLGSNTNIDSVKIEWLDGTKTVLNTVKANSTLTINKADQKAVAMQAPKILSPFQDITDKIQGFNFTHRENPFDDFAKEVLLPHQFSTLGPCLAVADINGDGLDDYFLGGSLNSPAQLMVQAGQGFQSTNINVLNNDAKYEDLGAHFFDFDNDGDLDLYVASGGGGDIENNLQLAQDRLYINNGKGDFAKAAKGILPTITSSTSRIVSIDFENDGDLDLFVGGRNNPGKYPLAASSYFLINDGGKLINKTSATFEIEELPGMVTGAVFTDINADQKPDMVLCGEWGTPMVLLRKGNKYRKANIKAFEKLTGWWQNMIAADFDKDGDVDFIFGNIGENNKFKPSAKKPLGVLACDFDENGTHDVVLTKLYNNKTVPVRGKECSTEQMPYLEEKFPEYKSFASASIEEILDEKKMKEAYRVQAYNFSSIVVKNNGNLNFEVQKLPFAIQSAPARGFACDDYNKDGILDVFVAGNILNTEPETPAYDAGKGTLLIGKGDCTFTADHQLNSTGVICNKNVSTIAPIKLGANRKGILVANNNDRMQLLLNQ